MTLQRKTSVATPPRASGVAAPDRARSWLLAALTALVVARPLLPSEGVSWLGDGQPFDMLAILIAAAYSLWAIAQGGFARRFNIVDAAIGALVALCIAAALFGAQNGSPRPAINMLFEWVAMGLVFFLTRQLVRTALETRAVVAVMVALAVVMAGIGFYQVYVSLPADRAAYAEDPDRVLRESGQWYPPGSPARVQFENRLQSSEPTATFALANSLAGFLAPWLVMGVGIALGQFDRRRGGSSFGVGQSTGTLARPLAFALCLVAVAGCLVLTKSRSAYVALAVGAALFPLLDRGVRRRVLNVRFAWAAGAILLLVIGGAIATGGLDIQVLTETNKSLGYRLEYWRSTLAMIGRHPWLGVGPGNFQDYYTQFKLPQASEEIRDPHNFLLEVWATAGTFAVVALCQALGALALRTWRMSDSADEPAAKPSVVASSGERAAERSTIATAPNGAPRNAAFIAAGAGLGFLLAFVVGALVGLSFSDGQLVGGLAAGGAVLALVWPWIVRGALPARLPALAVLVLLIHWLGAGSIAYPGVAYSFWMLLALGLNQTEGELSVATADPARRRVPWAPVAGLVITGGAAVACYLLAYGPVLHSQVVMSRLEDVHKNTDARVNLLLDAVAADPLSSEPWSAIAQIELARLKENPDNPESMKRFVTATNHVVELRPHSSAAWHQIGRWYSEFHEANHHALTAKLTAKFFANAVELYPNLASLRAEYALALQQNGEPALARRQIEMARRLDEQTPHADKKLSSELRRQLDELDPPPR